MNYCAGGGGRDPQGYLERAGKHAKQMHAMWAWWRWPIIHSPDAASMWRVYYNREMKRKIGKRGRREKERKREREVKGCIPPGGKAGGHGGKGRVFP